MSFKDLKLKKIYRNGENSFNADFLIPALTQSVSYDRGVGYFSIETLLDLSCGLLPLLRNGGNIRVVTSVELAPEDIELIKKGFEVKGEELLPYIEDQINKETATEAEKIQMDLITNLIAAGRLTIKIAYKPKGGIYHEKIGYLSDADGNQIYFAGSNNDTYSAENRNLESAMVLYSWKGDEEDVNEQSRYFNNLWNNKLGYIKVFDFPVALKLKLFDIHKSSESLDDAIEKYEKYFGSSSSGKKTKNPYPYQLQAISEFLKNDGCHFFEMATGTGKTFTSVKAVEALFKQENTLAVLVLVPQIDLQGQWKKAFQEIKVESLLLGGEASSSQTDANFDAFVINSFTDNSLNVAISTYDTFFAKFSDSVSGLLDSKLIIIDEAHNLSHAQIQKLPECFRYRLGLSATPERYSVSETEAIVNFFTRGKIETFKYTIEEAIDNGFLSHYCYYPIFVHLEEKEFSVYQSYTKKIITEYSKEIPDEKVITDLKIARSRVIKKATGKLVKLAELLDDKNYSFKNSVVYCGSGKDFDTETPIIDIATRLLSKNYRVAQFTSHTAFRPKVLTEFENNFYDTLVAIKCFDEGVDVPKLDKIYIMASDALSRQTIQRRGRVLRQCFETGKTIAHIYDFITLPPENLPDGISGATLVKNEFNRVKEYNRLANNSSENEQLFSDIYNIYGVEEEEEDYGGYEFTENI